MSAPEYANYLFIRRLASAQFDKRIGQEWLEESELEAALQNEMSAAFLHYGIDVGNFFVGLVRERFGNFVKHGIFSKEGDNYTGYYYRISAEVKSDYCKRFLDNLPVANRIRALGEPALVRALNALAVEKGWNRSDATDETFQFLAESGRAPASDRVVSFSDNEILDLDAKSTELIDQLSKQNQIAETPGLRELILGQLKAGRELIRAGSVRLFVLQVTLLESLTYLAKKYDGEIVGALAGQLIEALLKLIGIDS